ncbi:MAG: hypothetical protein AMJ84_04785 [Acidithiobacillales bacterium SM23_46]|nr:MAG: hypothetical protein AMJ84_04785 [Acidithiobacillales bacterium SM23_46]
MIRLYVVAALATLSIPVLVPQRFASILLASQWVPVFLLAEILISACFLKVAYPRNDFIRCVTFGLVFFLVRLVLCFGASLVDPEADVLWAGVSYRWGQALVPTLSYMYSAWWVVVAQYLTLLLWMPAVLETALPGRFQPRSVRMALAPSPGTIPAVPRPARPPKEPRTFRDLERELAGYPGLVGWIVFSPERLPVWRSGEEDSALEVAPDSLRQLGKVCQPLSRAEWGRTLGQGMFHQTENTYYLLTTLPGDFLFVSLWRVEAGQRPAKAVLREVFELMERCIQYQFTQPS